MGRCANALRKKHKAYSFPLLDAVYDHTKDLLLAIDDQVPSNFGKARKESPPCETCVKATYSLSTTSRKSSLKRDDFRRERQVSWSPVLAEVIEVQETKRSRCPWIRSLINTCVLYCSHDTCPVQTTHHSFGSCEVVGRGCMRLLKTPSCF